MNKNLVYLLIAVIVIGGGILLFGGEGPAPSPDDQMEEVPATSTENGDATMDEGSNMDSENSTGENESMSENQDSVTVTYTDEGFSPQSVGVSQGGTVTFMNDSSQGMWVASNVHPTHRQYDGTSLSEHCDNGSDVFDACEEIPAGESWSFTFDQSGSWGYHNHTSSGDTGVVVVQ